MEKSEKGMEKFILNMKLFLLKFLKIEKEVYAGMDGKDVVFGIRPENIHNPEFCPPGIVKADVAAKVDVTELISNEILYIVLQVQLNFPLALIHEAAIVSAPR